MERGGVAGPCLFTRAGIHVLPGVDAMRMLPVEFGEFPSRESLEALVKGFPEHAPFADHLAIGAKLKYSEIIMSV